MARKKASLSRWEGAVARGDLLDKPVDLSNLFNPNTFLNAIRQQVSACSTEADDRLVVLNGVFNNLIYRIKAFILL